MAKNLLYAVEKEYIFARCFLIICWNLMCRANTVDMVVRKYICSVLMARHPLFRRALNLRGVLYVMFGWFGVSEMNKYSIPHIHDYSLCILTAKINEKDYLICGFWWKELNQSGWKFQMFKRCPMIFHRNSQWTYFHIYSMWGCSKTIQSNCEKEDQTYRPIIPANKLDQPQKEVSSAKDTNYYLPYGFV